MGIAVMHTCAWSWRLAQLSLACGLAGLDKAGKDKT